MKSATLKMAEMAIEALKDQISYHAFSRLRLQGKQKVRILVGRIAVFCEDLGNDRSKFLAFPSEFFEAYI